MKNLSRYEQAWIWGNMIIVAGLMLLLFVVSGSSNANQRDTRFNAPALAPVDQAMLLGTWYDQGSVYSFTAAGTYKARGFDAFDLDHSHIWKVVDDQHVLIGGLHWEVTVRNDGIGFFNWPVSILLRRDPPPPTVQLPAGPPTETSIR